MEKFLINPLSPIDQCSSINDVAHAVANLVSCFEYLLPAINAKRAVLLYDDSLRGRSLVAGENLSATIARLRGLSDEGGDLVRKWYLYSQNRAEDVTDYGAVVALSCPQQSFATVHGTVCSIAALEELYWLSFGQSRFGEALTYQITGGQMQMTGENAHTAQILVQSLPRYEPSAKHRKEPYFDKERGESVAAMPLSADFAQKVLLAGISQGSDIWSFDGTSRCFFRFKRTGGNVFHGFVVGPDEVPAAIKDELTQ